MQLICPTEEEVPDVDEAIELTTRFSFSDINFSMLRDCIEKIRPKLVVIDPIYMLLRNEGVFNSQKLMLWLEKLEHICHLYDCACVIVRACKEKSADSGHIMPIERSPILWRCAHSVFSIHRHPSAPGYFFFANSKQRTIAPSLTIRFYISATEANPTVPQIHWLDQHPFSIDDLTKPR